VSGDESPAAPPRPWWAPLLGVGSLGFGGFQVLAGLAVMAVAVLIPSGARGTLALLGLAWALPGLLLGIGGAMITVGARRGRAFSLAAIALCAVCFGVVAVARTSIPTAVADAGEWGLKHPKAPAWAVKAYEDETRRQGIDAIAFARDPVNAETLGRVYAGACCALALPWYLTVLVACAGHWGRRMARY
jgi:hypothetical protein